MYVGNQLPTPIRKSGVAAPVLYNWKTCQNATGLAQPASPDYSRHGVKEVVSVD